MSILRNIVKSSVVGLRVTHLGLGTRLAQQPFRVLSTELKERLDGLVQAHKVVVFMKGVPDEPRCGFSNAVVQILRMHGVDQYGSHDILEDEDLRQGIKEYTEWPTIPQVFLDGEFVGGCDIMIQMHQNGDLIEELKKIGIRSALLDVPKEEEPSQ